MAGAQDKSPSSVDQRRRQSRLQKRAPASIQVRPASSFASDWKVAIPLLSPLVVSPSSPPKLSDRTAEKSSSSSTEESAKEHRQIEKQSFKSWQHPAAPFHYDPAPYLPSFVPKCR